LYVIKRYVVFDLIHKIYPFKQDLDTMMQSFSHYIGEVFYPYRKKSIKGLYELENNDLRKELRKFIDGVENPRHITLGNWSYARQAYYALGRAYMAADNLQEAVRLFRKCDTYIPYNGYELYEIARYFKDKKMNDDAIAFFKKSMEWARFKKRQDVSAASLYHLGEIYYFLDNVEQALNYFEKCLALQPDHRKAHEYVLRIRAVQKEKEVDTVFMGDKLL
jgi:tetratricopeptide (TPR) repeat protein